ncbi:MAG: hypothetical protein AAFX78_03555 [Cyanobacteria bacterium J06638_20]
MTLPSQKIPPSGRTTLRIDWGDFLRRLPGAPSLANAAWTVPTGLTEVSSSSDSTISIIVIDSSGLTKGATYTLTCTATLTDSDIQQAELPLHVAPLGVQSVTLPAALSVSSGDGGNGGNGGTSDHGNLSGLNDDDHPQYALADGTRGSFEAAGVVAALQASLGTAATEDVEAFATDAQGALAGTALQPASIGSTVQARDARLDAIAALVTAGFLIIDGNGDLVVKPELLLADIPDGYDYQKLTNRPDISALDELESHDEFTDFPDPGDVNKLYIDLSDGIFYRWDGVSAYVQLTGRASIWGQISGAIANQSDLVAELNARDTANRNRSNHTGTQAQSTITGLPAALADKAPLTSPAFTGTPTAPTPSASSNSTQLATTAMVQAAISNAVTAALQSRELPVGSIYQNDRDGTNPATLLGYGTWQSLGAGRVLVGIDPSDTDFDTAGAELGEKEITLSVAQMPEHPHNLIGFGPGGSTSVYNPQWVGSSALGLGITSEAVQPAGGDQPHNNVQPSLVVYRWVRTA